MVDSVVHVSKVTDCSAGQYVLRQDAVQSDRIALRRNLSENLLGIVDNASDDPAVTKGSSATAFPLSDVRCFQLEDRVRPSDLARRFALKERLHDDVPEPLIPLRHRVLVDVALLRPVS